MTAKKTTTKPESKDDLIIKALLHSDFEDRFLPEALKKRMEMHIKIIIDQNYTNFADAYDSFEAVQACKYLLEYYGDYTSSAELMITRKTIKNK